MNQIIFRQLEDELRYFGNNCWEKWVGWSMLSKMCKCKNMISAKLRIRRIICLWKCELSGSAVIPWWGTWTSIRRSIQAWATPTLERPFQLASILSFVDISCNSPLWCQKAVEGCKTAKKIAFIERSFRISRPSGVSCFLGVYFEELRSRQKTEYLVLSGDRFGLYQRELRDSF